MLKEGRPATPRRPFFTPATGRLRREKYMLTGLALRILVALQSVPAAQDEDGQTLAEYSLIIGVIAVAIVGIALVVFRDALAGAFNGVIPCLTGSC
jgi:Flp pilus assembly pilin Flp